MTDEVKMAWLKISHHSPAHCAAHWPYAAFGSNLSFKQMADRCSRPEVLTAGKLMGARFAFAHYATIIADKDHSTPVGIYKLSANDIEKLDKKEGLGRAYERYLVTPITDDGRALRTFTYIKKDETPQPPSDKYYARILEGYASWHFDDRRLRHARERAQAAWNAGAAEREKSVTTRAIEALDDVRRKYAHKSASVAWAQGEMWEPVNNNAMPLRAQPEIVAPHARIDWGFKDGEHYFRVKGDRVWYRDISTPEDIAMRIARGVPADNLPGSRAYRPVDKRGK